MGDPIRLVLVDDHPIVLAGLQQLLSVDPRFKVLTTARSTTEAWEAIAQHAPDIVVLDLKLGDEMGLSLLSRLTPGERPFVVVLTAAEEENLLLDAVRLGARGLVLKATAPRVIEECLQVVHGGGTWLRVEGVDLADRYARRKSVEAELASTLTARELEVVRLTFEGLDNQQIAERLSIGVGTVKIHLHHIYDKLGLQGRPELQRLLIAKQY
jgi:DNA-binding NarL/FixJ family response regulator